MGTLRIRFVANVPANEQARILAALRKLKATVRSRPQHAGPETWIFDTLPLAPPTRQAASNAPRPPRVVSDREWAKRYVARVWFTIARASTGPIGDRTAGWHDAVASWNGDVWTWERLTRRQEILAAVAIARSCTTTPLAPFPPHTRGEGMPNNPNWSEYDQHLREIYAVAADLVAGRGGPDAYRVHGANPRLLMPAFGRTPLIVGVWDEPYGPVAAMCVAGFILHGTTFEQRFAQMGIIGDLIEAYEMLAQHYGPRVPCLEAPSASTTSLAKALESPRADGFLKLTVKKPAPQLSAPRRPALADSTSRQALPDLGARS